MDNATTSHRFDISPRKYDSDKRKVVLTHSLISSLIDSLSFSSLTYLHKKRRRRKSGLNLVLQLDQAMSNLIIQLTIVIYDSRVIID